jgi:uncharacterized protein
MSGVVDRFGSLLAAWSAWLCRAPRIVLAIALVLSAVLLAYAARELRMHTDTTDIISDELPSRQDYIALRAAFPQLVGSLIVVIDGITPEVADDARARLADRLARDPGRFPWVFAPGGDAFFARNGLLYAELADLETLSDRLVRAQPLLGPLARDPSLGGLASALDLVARAPPDAREGASVEPLLAALAAAFDAAAAGRFHRLAWAELLGGTDPAGNRRLLLLQPVLERGSLAPARPAIDAVRGAADELGIDEAHGLRLRLTGPVALEHEELMSVARGAARASVLALVMVAVVLGVGLGSVRLVFAAIATLLVGLVATAAFAALAVGDLNLISIAFVVLYVGLGIDYSVHLCLRYRELRAGGEAHAQALHDAVQAVGSSLVLCAITNSVGFFAFYPTTFKGVAELGLISGTGMWIALFLSVSLLPVLLTLWPYDPSRHARPWRAVALAPRLPPRAVIAGAVLLAAGSLALLPRARFDSNPLNLRAPDSESVATFRELLERPESSPFTLAWLARDLATARAAAASLDGHPAVAHARTIEDLVPQRQDEKLAVIDDLGFVLGPTLSSRAPAQETVEDLAAALPALEASLRRVADAGFAQARPAVDALAAARAAIERAPPAERDTRAAALDESVLFGLRFQLARLREAMQAQPVTLDDLPETLAALWRSADGQYRVEIAPAENLAQPGATERFVADVREVLPHATGLPVIQQEAGAAVAGAFTQALVTALVAVALLTFLLMRSVRDSVLVLTPVLLGTLLTVAATVVFDMPFNFANVIALPLLLGICVDNGIHIVHRHRAGPSPGGLLASSTARAVVVSALTTIVTFGNLAFSGHPGMASMGRLLAIGLTLGLACSLLTLPALLEWHETARAREGVR